MDSEKGDTWISGVDGQQFTYSTMYQEWLSCLHQKDMPMVYAMVGKLSDAVDQELQLCRKMASMEDINLRYCDTKLDTLALLECQVHLNASDLENPANAQ